MSAIGGIIAKNGMAPSVQAITSLAEAMTSGGPDGCKWVVRNNVAIIFREFRTTPESNGSRQPYAGSGDVIAAWDGRLDNREEILAATGEAAGSADVELIAAVYNRWGAECATHLTGDFAFSVWDGGKRSLMLARDAIGARSAYYAVTDELVIWASEIRALLNFPGIDAEIDDEYMAGYIIIESDPGRSPFKSIKPIPPGTTVIITDTNIAVRRHWSLDARQALRYSSDAEYEAHFRELFFQAEIGRAHV